MSKKQSGFIIFLLTNHCFTDIRFLDTRILNSYYKEVESKKPTTETNLLYLIMHRPTSINDTLKSFVANYMHLFEQDFPMITRGKNDVFILKNELIIDKHLDLYDELYETLGVEPNYRATNIGDASFDRVTKQPIWFNAPVIGLKSGKLGLMIGVDSPKTQDSSCFIPLMFHDSGKPEDGLTPSKYYYFSLDGGKTKTIANLIPMPSSYGDHEIRYYVVPSKPGMTLGFYIPFKADKDVTDETIIAAWESGNFEAVCNPFNTTFVNFSNCFGKAFQDGSFPAEGVLILLKNGKLNVTNWNNTKIMNAKWQVADSTHPNLLLGLYESKMLTGTTTLSDASVFSTGSSSEPYSLVNMQIEMGKSPVQDDGTDTILIDYCLLYVQSPNMQRTKGGQTKVRYDYQPVHKATSNPQKLTIVFPKLGELYPDFLMKANQLILEAKMVKSKVIKQVEQPVFTQSDSDDSNWESEVKDDDSDIPF